jgi:hypothetical protein
LSAKIGKKNYKKFFSIGQNMYSQLHIHNYTSEDSSSVEASIRRGRRRVSISIRWVCSA